MFSKSRGSITKYCGTIKLSSNMILLNKNILLFKYLLQSFSQLSLVTPQPTLEFPSPPVTTVEVLIAIKKMKNGKAAGLNYIRTEIWKIPVEGGPKFFAALVN